jgi:lipopolysaccharide export system protein LptA
MRKLIVLALMLAAGAAFAAEEPGKSSSLLGKHDSNKPINIAADKVLADLNAKSVTYSGNVVVTQGDIRMHADAMKVNTDNGKAQTIQADGKVVVDSPASGTVTGDNGVYNVAAHTVLMSGKVVLTHGKDVMRGTRLTVNLDTGQAVLGASGNTANGVTTPGRVQGVFSPTGGN